MFSYYLTQTLKTNAVICGKIFYEELREKRQINRCLEKFSRKVVYKAAYCPRLVVWLFGLKQTFHSVDTCMFDFMF